MCSQVAKTRIHNLNRHVIAILSIIGFALDGINMTDLFFVIALVLWIWQPECDNYEERFLDVLTEAQCRLFSLARVVKKS